MSLSKQEFTNAGKSMLGRAQAGEVLTITKIVVGSGSVTQASDLWPLTSLVNHQMDVAVSAKQDYGDGTMLVEGSFLSSDAPAVFQLREVGVMAHIGAEADRLYSVANVLTDPPDTVDPGSPSLQAFKIKLVIDRIPEASLIIQIGPSENVIGQNLATAAIGPGVYKDAAGNVLNFKRLNAGAGIELIEDAGATYITIAQKRLKQNVDLYVPQTYPGISDPTVLFPTIQAAHDYLLSFVIPSDKIATIHVYSGTFNNSPPGAGLSAINFNHPNSKQIRLWGQPRIDKNIQSIGNVLAASKDVTLDNVSSLAVGQRVYLAACGGTYQGGCRITAIVGNKVTCTLEKRDTQANYTTVVGAAGRLCFLPTIVRFTNGTGPGGNPAAGEMLLSCPFGIGEIKNICFAGGQYTLNIMNDGNLINVAVLNVGTGDFKSARGVNVVGGTLGLGQECCITQCDFGITGTGLAYAFDQTYINACGNAINPSGAGFAIGSILNGMAASGTICYILHNQTGVYAAIGGSFRGGSWLAWQNDVCLHASSLGVAILDFDQNSLNMNGLDLQASEMGFIQYGKLGGGEPTADPPANANTGVNNNRHNAYIYTH